VPFDLTDKVVFITGAGRGIGRGIADVLAEAGADIALNALTPTYVEPAAAAVAEASGRRVVPVLADVTSPDGVDAAVAQTIDAFGRIDVLVNCLGDSIRGAFAPGPDPSRPAMSDADVTKTLDLNLNAALLCARAVGPLLIAQGGGKVINVSAFAAARGGDGLVVYATAKTALVGFTRALALEWARFNVQVNCIAPGIFPDPVSHTEAMAGREEALMKQIPLRRFGDLREVGHLARYLASAESDYLTGQTIHLDGGMTL
jgi:NAD(P)-dependent dehydrogenase (short-subunit alcohol dehydrogenase family)